jgi:peptide chain release factor 1
VVLSCFTFSGKGVEKYFQNEVGNHRWQRVSPTEKRGRTHTSSVTVALIPEEEYNFKLNRQEVDRKYTRSSGKGGQHRNKVETCVVLTHKPTGIQVRIGNNRERHRNEELAWEEMERRLKEIYFSEKKGEEIGNRLKQIGKGGRSDKRRTYRVKDDIVVDHITNKKTSLKKILRGNIELLH